MTKQAERPITHWLCNRCNAQHEGGRIPGKCKKCRGVEFRAVRESMRDHEAAMTCEVCGSLKAIYDDGLACMELCGKLVEHSKLAINLHNLKENDKPSYAVAVRRVLRKLYPNQVVKKTVSEKESEPQASPLPGMEELFKEESE